MASIDLSRNDAIGDEGIACIASAAKQRAGDGAQAFPSLEEMTLSECSIGPPGARSLVGLVLSPDGARRPKWIRLALGSNPIGAEGCAALSELCAVPGRGSSLSRLRLPGCSAGDGGIGCLSAAATSRPCAGMEALDLSDNSVTKDGAGAFADSLVGSWPDLAELRLAKNELGPGGVAAVMGALVGRDDETAGAPGGTKNSTLRDVDLTRTNCGAKGAEAALTRASLSTLRLFNNRLGSDGFRSIAPLLRGGHPFLENLDLGGNDAEEDAVVALLNAIADKGDGVSKLAVLKIGGNKFGDDAMAALEELKRVWPRLDVAHDEPVQDADDDDPSPPEEGPLEIEAE